VRESQETKLRRESKERGGGGGQERARRGQGEGRGWKRSRERETENDGGKQRTMDGEKKRESLSLCHPQGSRKGNPTLKCTTKPHTRHAHTHTWAMMD